MTGSSVKLTRNGRATIPPTSASVTNSTATPFRPPATAEIPLHHRLDRLNIQLPSIAPPGALLPDSPGRHQLRSSREFSLRLLSAKFVLSNGGAKSPCHRAPF